MLVDAIVVGFLTLRKPKFHFAQEVSLVIALVRTGERKLQVVFIFLTCTSVIKRTLLTPCQIQ